ncbi:DUF4913 domain-containing protein [Streptomyces sp. NPDC087844]|uniref:DUF4913 domain-containing protein n=1 Tax=Streptomyces sp. NPDC087844 TaxID=3365805 RepID=UPI0037F92B00
MASSTDPEAVAKAPGAARTGGWVRSAPSPDPADGASVKASAPAPVPAPRADPPTPPDPPTGNPPEAGSAESAPTDPERDEPVPPRPAPDAPPPSGAPPFVLYKSGGQFGSAVSDLADWVHGLLIPVYGREISSTAPWCPRWYEHMEAIAQLYGLWMAWQDLTGSGSPMTGPAMWHRDYLTPVMNSLRDPSGVFAGCKPGQHRPKEPPPIDAPDAA